MSSKDAPSRRASGEEAETEHVRRRFPARSLSLALGLSFAACLWFAWNAYRSQQTEHAQQRQQLRYEELRGIIVHLDEVLTMSARMAAAAGDTTWERRYRRFEPQLDAAIKEVERLAPRRPAIVRAAEETDRANRELVGMEHHAFDLVRSGQAEQALAVVLSPAYQEQKRLHASGIAKVVQLVADEMRVAEQLTRRNMRLSMAGALSAVVVAAILWVVAVLHLGRWREDLVTALREREAAETRYRDLVETAQDLVWQCDAEGRYTYLNPAWEEILGYRIEEMLGKRFTEFQPPEYAERDREEFARLMKGATVKGLETVHLGKEGREVQLVFNAKALFDAKGKIAGTRGTAYDISARAAAEAAAKRATAELEILHELDTAILEARTVDEIAMAAVERLGALIPADRTSLAVFDEEAGLAQVFAAGVLEEEIGGSRTVPITGAFLNLDELRAGEVTRIDDLAAVDDLDALSARLREAGIRSMVSVPVRALGVLLGSLNAAATKPAAFSDADIEVAREVADTLAIALEQARLHEAVVRHAEELESRVAERTAELAARTGEAEKLNRAMLNLLEDLRAEQVRTREIAQRLEISNRELESFAYSVSHDLRAPLRAIDGFGEALAEDLAGRLDERQQDDLGRMRAAARRMGSMIDDLLALSRAGRVEMERQQVDLSKVAGEVVAELREGEAEREVEVTVAPGLTARGDPRLLRLVLQNLIGNAWKFTGPREAAAIEFGRRDDGDEGVFYVRDNGVGFDMRYADKLFGAFQRMHRQDEFPGDGIGLATVQRIVARHGGRVWAEAEEGAGATFYFTLNGG